MRVSRLSLSHSHYRIDASAVALPHRSEPGLTANVPDFDCDVALCYLAHVEAHRGDHVLVELAALQGTGED